MARIYSYYHESGSNTPEEMDYRCYVDYSYSQNKTANTSTITAKIYLQLSQGTWLNDFDARITIDGTTKTFSTSSGSVSVGTHLMGTYTKTITHNNDGTRSYKIQGSIRWISDSYVYTTNKSETLPTIPRYADVTTFTGVATGLQSMNITWEANASCDSIQYRLNGGSWVTPTGTTYPTFAITGLSPNTQYTVEIQVRRTDSQLWKTSSAITVTTLDIAKITSGTPNFNIGNNLAVTFSNPSGATTNIRIETLNPTTNRITRNNVTSPYTITFTQAEIDLLHSCTPNSNSLTIRVVVDTVYNGSTYCHWVDGTAKVVDKNPTFAAFAYLDTNSSVVSITGSNQNIVKNKSQLRVVISAANKMVAKASATPINYLITCDDKSKSVNYSTSDINVDLGTIVNAGTKRLSVKAIDSRGNSTTVYYDITIYDYNKPIINVIATRLNDFENQTTIQTNGTFSLLTIGGSNKNTIAESNVKYRYAQAGATMPSTWTTMTRTLTNNTFSCSNIVLNLDNTKAFNIEIQVADKLDTTTLTILVDVGQELMYLNSETGDLDIKGNFTAGGNISGQEVSGTNIRGTAIYSNGTKLENFTSKYVPSNSNLNNYTTPGMYYNPSDAETRTMSNVPQANAFSLLVERHAGYKQTFTVYFTGNPYTWVRNYYNGSWGAWRRIAFISYGTAAPGTLLDGEIYIKY